MPPSRVNLLFMNGEKRVSGCHVFTYHLARALLAVGVQAQVWKFSSGRGSHVPEPLWPGCDIIAQPISMIDVRPLAQAAPTCIAFARTEYDHEAAAIIRSTGTPIVIHDMRGWYPECREAVFDTGTRVGCIRPAVRKALETDGVTDVICLLHPYEPELPVRIPSHYNGICLSRIAREKNIGMIIEANKLLPAAQRIAVLGHADEPLGAMALRSKYGEELEELMLRPQRIHITVRHEMGATHARLGRFAVDLSVLKQVQSDGGGSQYTFLEAMGASVPLVVHNDWVQRGGEMQPEVNCHPVHTVPELVEFAQRRTMPDYRKGYAATLAVHAYKRTGKLWLNFIQG